MIRQRSIRQLAIAALLGATAISSPIASAQAQQNTLVIAGITTPKGFDGDVFLPGTLESVVNINEGLTEYGRTKDSQGRDVLDAANVSPHLAESWTVSPDGKTYTFKLRSAKSPFGNELIADDLIFGMRKSEEQKRTGLFLKTVALIDTIEKVSDKEIRYNLKSPNRSFLRVLQLYTPGIYDSRKAREFATADDPFATKWLGQNTAAYGAYHLQENRQGEGAIFVANPNYFGPKPFYNRVVFREVPSPANRAALVRNGDAQWAEQVPMQSIPDLMRDRNVQVQQVIGTGTAHALLNAKYKPFDDVRVRRAIIQATDFEAINKTVFLGLGTRSRSFLPSILPGHIEAYRYETNYDAAKKLLTEAGYPNGVDVTLEYADNYWWEEQFSIQVKESAAKAGIRVTPKRIPSTEMNTRRGPGQRTIPFFTYQTTPFVLDPGYAFYLSAHTAGSNNTAAYFKKEMDDLIDQIVVEKDDAKWKSLLADAQRMHAEDAIYLDTYYPGVYAVMAPCMRGWLWRPVPYAYWRDLRCERR
ncbi:MAG: ABC transporter substrate-binding protein [Alphaproteobacteria bacterium]|nr:ABC transporter substrate-binding protein [Alphaproteobacteria bacterium]